MELAAWIVVFLVSSGLLALIDAAVLSVTRAEVEEAVLNQRWGAPSLKTVKGRMARSVAVIVLATNTVNVVGPILLGQRALTLYGSGVIAALTAGLTFGTIVFSEVIPKSLGEHYAPGIACRAAPIIRATALALAPLVMSLEALSGLFKRGKRAVGTEKQIRSLATLGLKAGRIEADEQALIERVFLLNDKTAGDVMTGRDAMVWLAADHTIAEASEAVLASGFSRFPVFGEGLDDARGVAWGREVLAALLRGRGEEELGALIRPIEQVPPTTHTDDLLARLQGKKRQIALVKEGSRTLGLVTLDDVLEELVGPLEEERPGLVTRRRA